MLGPVAGRTHLPAAGMCAHEQPPRHPCDGGADPTGVHQRPGDPAPRGSEHRGEEVDRQQSARARHIVLHADPGRAVAAEQRALVRLGRCRALRELRVAGALRGKTTNPRSRGHELPFRLRLGGGGGEHALGPRAATSILSRKCRVESGAGVGCGDHERSTGCTPRSASGAACLPVADRTPLLREGRRIAGPLRRQHHVMPLVAVLHQARETKT